MKVGQIGVHVSLMGEKRYRQNYRWCALREEITREKCVLEGGLSSYGSGEGPVAGSFEDGNEISGTVKSTEHAD
jgi:hypothetical protein